MKPLKIGDFQVQTVNLPEGIPYGHGSRPIDYFTVCFGDDHQ